jgi:EmrB/QacA subfamily drug resistance transporter
MIEKAKNHWLILFVLALAQFMVVLDSSIVNVALPAIQKTFSMTQSNLQWIVTAYTLAFGGFLLLGGRAADLYGRRKLFMIGTAVFGVASLIDGLAPTGTLLIALRAAQGLAAALMSPAALSIVLVTYREGHERNTALSVWGAVASGGAAAGVLFGGIITEYLGWRWNFLINVPISIGVFLAARALVPLHESEETHNDLDLPGAISITAALMTLVYGLVEAPSHGWTSVSSLLYFAVALALFVFFYFNEKRSEHPLVPFDIFRIRNVTAANMVQLPVMAGMFSVFFFTSLYIQTVLHYSPVKTGLSFLAVPISIAISATQIPKVIKRIGYKPVLMVAPLVVATALFLLAHVRVDGDYVHDILPGFILMGLGMGATFVSLVIAATSGVTGRESGLASGLLNTSQQIGGALGLAILSGIAASTTARFIQHSSHVDNLTKLTAQVHGYHAAYYLAVGFMILAASVATFVMKQQKVSAKDLEAAATAAAG